MNEVSGVTPDIEAVTLEAVASSRTLMDVIEPVPLGYKVSGLVMGEILSV